MPKITTQDGIEHYVPGVYGSTDVKSSLAGPVPQFQIPVALVGAFEGIPWNAASATLMQTGEVAPSMFKKLQTEGAVATEYGRNSEAHQAMAWAKRHGLPFAYLVCMAALTRASVLVTSGSGPAVNQFYIYARKFGAPANFIGFKFTGGVLTITPVKNYAFINANAGTTVKRLYFSANPDWAIVGKTVSIASNVAAVTTRAITSIGVEYNAAGQKQWWVELATAPGTALNTSDYAAIYEYDTALTLSGITTSQQIIDWLNTSPLSKSLFWCVKHAAFTDASPNTIASTLPLKEIATWATPTKGTSPAPTLTDYNGFITNMNAGAWATFCVAEQVIPQCYYASSSLSTVHGVLRDYAIAERNRLYPISVTSGGAWGDVVVGAGADTDPSFRSAALNDQNTSVWFGGLDRYSAVLSLAAAVWARRVSGGPKHNLTNDEIIASEFEVAWNEINSGELTTLCKKGAGTYKLSLGQTFRYRVCEGLSTLQRNASSWNEDDATTPLLMQRDLADFVDRVVRTDFEELGIGADEIDANVLKSLLSRRVEKTLIAAGYVLDFTITSVTLNATGTGWIVQWSVSLPTTTDFIEVYTTILIGA